MLQYNYKNICTKVLSSLPQKQKQVLERRFGLAGGGRETLQAIGDSFGVTRERIRQVESEGFLKLRQQEEDRDLKKVFTGFVQYLKSQGGLKREDILLTDLGKGDSQNHVLFLFTLGQDFHRVGEDSTVYSFWTITPDLSERAKALVGEVVKKLSRGKQPLGKEKILSSLQEPNVLLLGVFEIAKDIEEGPLGNLGLVSWPEIKPRGVRDAAFLCLKKAGKPLHFREIATLAGDLKGEFFSRRQILPQTVHNELIRDPRFVLVGRGVYALKEWGYIEGTVSDVIREVLVKAKQPLAREEVVKMVLVQRVVKPNTILLNLNNQMDFQKDPEGKYTIRES